MGSIFMDSRSDDGYSTNPMGSNFVESRVANGYSTNPMGSDFVESRSDSKNPNLLSLFGA